MVGFVGVVGVVGAGAVVVAELVASTAKDPLGIMTP